MKNLIFRICESRNVTFETILPNRINNRFYNSQSFGLGADIKEIHPNRFLGIQFEGSKAESDSAEASEVITTLNSWRPAYEEHELLLKRNSRFLRTSLITFFQKVVYLVRVAVSRPHRTFQRLPHVPNLFQQLVFDFKCLVLRPLFFRRSMFDAFDSEATMPYAVYPLQVVPESGIMSHSKVCDEIAFAIELASRIPAGRHLYVKEHPGMMGYRTLKSYARLKKVFNVSILHPYEDNRLVLSGAEAVFTQNGTVGLEAAIHDKPVFVFGSVEYASISNVYPSSLDDLKYFESIDKSKVSDAESYVSTTLKNSIKLDMNYILYGPTKPNCDLVRWRIEIDRLLVLL